MSSSSSTSVSFGGNASQNNRVVRADVQNKSRNDRHMKSNANIGMSIDVGDETAVLKLLDISVVLAAAATNAEVVTSLSKIESGGVFGYR